MKKILTLMSIFIVSTNACINMTDVNYQTTHSKKQTLNKNNLTSSEDQSKIIEELDEWYNSLNPDQIDKAKTGIADSLIISQTPSGSNSNLKYNVSVNTDKINDLYNTQIINEYAKGILLDKDYGENITKELNDSKNTSLTVDSNHIIYNGDSDSLDKSSTSSKVWVIAHWYWLGVWMKILLNNLLQ